ncbi:XTP/dITP diphosphatase [uncultured Ruminococcus sp.]|uniref:XTP/dITP diphosphatase n=1 Tax=uncultured Ruminococcus sp. TaxID=165186 RepID=UPI0025EB80FC|nr:XTP/dITP diphosphatase [uncultured Ruminococcus sp.]
MKFIIATNNQKKLKELERILNPLGINAVSARDEGISLDDVEETGTTFAENAFLKAEAAFKKTGLPSVADDSGLCVDVLNGRPGIFSARYAGENATDEDKNNKLLSELKDVSEKDRTAHFTCAICCILPNGEKIEVEGVCEGIIAFEPHGNGGFGYDPIFKYGDRSYAELSSSEKDAVSHRGKALRKLKAELEKYLDK